MAPKVFLTTFLGLLVLLSACASPAPTPPERLTGRLQAIQQSGRLVIATSLFRPFEFYHPDSLQLTGFDIEVATCITAGLGVTIDWREMPFASLMPAVQAGQVDAAIAAIYITDARLQQVAFTHPYAQTGLVLVTTSGAPTPDPIPTALTGRRIGVKLGATGAKQAERWKADGTNLQIVSYSSSDEQMQALATGAVDYALNDLLHTLHFMTEHPHLKLAGEPLTQANLGIAVRRGDTELLQWLNQRLEQLESEGILDQLRRRWFNPHPDPPTPSDRPCPAPAAP